jgi:hypothetical protein
MSMVSSDLLVMLAIWQGWRPYDDHALVRRERFTLEVETSLPLDDDEIIRMYVNEEGVKEPVFATTAPIHGMSLAVSSDMV